MRNFVMVVALAGLAACAPLDTASRGSAGAGLTLATQGSPTILAPRYDVEAVRVEVPRSLQATEANTFLPRADIVWHGDPAGDRHTQVAAIFENAAAQATRGMLAGRPVTIDLVITRFHALTDITRATTGGNHAMRFEMTVRDAATGAVVEGPRPITADVRAAGGRRAAEEDRIGRTQKVVITERLVEVLRRELSSPIDPLLVARADQVPLMIAQAN